MRCNERKIQIVDNYEWQHSQTKPLSFEDQEKSQIIRMCLSGQRRTDYDVTNTINVTNTQDVCREVERLFYEITHAGFYQPLERSFEIFEALYEGKHPDYHRCDTDYHNKQHVLDVTLATIRLIAGRERNVASKNRFTAHQIAVAVITALFHDVGYLRKTDETHVKHGAEHTKIHVSRGADFLGGHMKAIGMGKYAAISKQLVHFTGYEQVIERIAVPSSKYRELGNIIGTADVIAQMADRVYLEKCRNYLYPEFVKGGMCEQKDAAGRTQILYSSAEELLRKTPSFMINVFDQRLTDSFDACFRYIEDYFHGINIYLINIQKNFVYLSNHLGIHNSDHSVQTIDDSVLRRNTLVS